jgi:hypothetical protein
MIKNYYKFYIFIIHIQINWSNWINIDFEFEQSLLSTIMNMVNSLKLFIKWN